MAATVLTRGAEGRWPALCWTTVALALFAVTPGPAATNDGEPPGCRHSTLGEPVHGSDREIGGAIRTWHGDFDGDGEPDELVVGVSQGSGYGSREATLRLADRSFTVTEGYSLYFMLDEGVPVPPELLEPGREGAREALEDALFGTVCAAPDPSLERLLQGSGPLVWADGPPVPPDGYAVLDRADPPRWLHYKGNLHTTSLAPMGDQPRSFPWEADRDDDYRLVLTAHGAVLTDLEATRHAWLYVFPGTAGHKLRWPSVQNGHLVDGTAVLELDTVGYDGGGTVTVDLTSGAISEEWESAETP